MKILYEIYLEYIFIFLIAFSFFSTIIFFKLLIPLFENLNFLDKPNNRSNHIAPVSLGGGLVIVPFIILATYLNGYKWSPAELFTLTFLFLISLIDDLRNVKASYRLLVHFSVLPFMYIFLY